jgi:FAD-dependent urate hydroxylase
VIDVVVIGAGPYGLSAASHLRSAGIETRVIGEPMELWRRHMPNGMLLRSTPHASSIADPAGRHTVERWAAAAGEELPAQLPLPAFLRYASWFREREVPEIDERRVGALSVQDAGFTILLDDGERLRARRVVVAGGPGPFTRRPATFAELPPGRVLHTSDLADLASFRDRRVLVVGAGQSALETAALLSEAGARVELVVRGPAIAWLPGDDDPAPAAEKGAGGRALAALRRAIPPPPTGVGGRASGWLATAPGIIHRSPAALRDVVWSRCIRPAGSAWIRPRLAGVALTPACAVSRVTEAAGAIRVELDTGHVREVDTIVLGTGYAVDVRRYAFLTEELLSALELHGGAPVLRRGLESSVARLHFLGAAAAPSFGPLLNFVVGTWFAGPALVDGVLERRGRLRIGIPPKQPVDALPSAADGGSGNRR